VTPRRFSHDLSQDGRLLTLHGEVDEGACVELRGLLAATTADLDGELTVDLSDVDFFPSAAIGVVIAAQNNARRSGASIGLLAAKGTIAQRVLTICGLEHREA
jgi:anti-anti-sigma factor